MLRIFFILFLSASCSLGVVKKGGTEPYLYDVHSDYTVQDLEELAPKIVETKKRDPQFGKESDLFDKKLPDIKRIGILIFESSVQPTRSGLSDENKIYLTDQGKQLLTESFLTVWDQSFPLLGEGLDYVATKKMKKSKALHGYGVAVEDHIKSKRYAMAPDDIFYLPAGKNTTTTTVLNPRGMQDVSFVLVPATELMMGPKFSEHNKHFLNEVVKELKLDAAIIILSEASWTASHWNKHSGEFVPEELAVKISSSILLPFTAYHDRLKVIGIKDQQPNTTICYRAYEAQVKVPVLISVPAENENFETIQTELLSPLGKSYKDVAQMVMVRMIHDLKLTH